MDEVAQLYARGQGLPKDLQAADLWPRKAAAHGTSGGLFYLGTAYEFGTVGPANLATAADYYFAAVEAGPPRAVEKINALLVKASALT